MKYMSMFDKIDLHLIRVLHTVLTERSVSRAAIRLGMYQPAVSAALKRLRDLAGDPLLVRSGSGMMPTAAGLRMIEPAAEILRSAEMLFSDARSFDPATARHTFSVAASDYLDPQFLPQLVIQLKMLAPNCPIEIHPLSADGDYRTHLAQGHVDVVIGNWPRPPGDLHLGRLFGDEVVSLVSIQHPAVRRGWDEAAWLAAEHIAPTPMHPGARGAIDDFLLSLQPGHLAQHRGPLPAFRTHSSHGGGQPAGADHRSALRRAFRQPTASAGPALSDRVPAPPVLPALARADPRLAGGTLAA